MLGVREPDIYGSLSLKDIQVFTEQKLASSDVEIDWFQSNHEGEIVDRIHQCLKESFKALVINPGAFSHSSVAILDALKMLSIPVIEVHLSNTHRREEFRSRKLTAKASTIIMEGLGKQAYFLAISSQIND